MVKALLPQAFWFRMAAACPRIDGIPRASGRGGLLDLPASCLMTDLSSLEGRGSWAVGAGRLESWRPGDRRAGQAWRRATCRPTAPRASPTSISGSTPATRET